MGVRVSYCTERSGTSRGDVLQSRRRPRDRTRLDHVRQASIDRAARSKVRAEPRHANLAEHLRRQDITIANSMSSSAQIRAFSPPNSRYPALRIPNVFGKSNGHGICPFEERDWPSPELLSLSRLAWRSRAEGTPDQVRKAPPGAKTFLALGNIPGLVFLFLSSSLANTLTLRYTYTPTSSHPPSSVNNREVLLLDIPHWAAGTVGSGIRPSITAVTPDCVPPRNTGRGPSQRSIHKAIICSVPYCPTPSRHPSTQLESTHALAPVNFGISSSSTLTWLSREPYQLVRLHPFVSFLRTSRRRSNHEF